MRDVSGRQKIPNLFFLFCRRIFLVYFKYIWNILPPEMKPIASWAWAWAWAKRSLLWDVKDAADAVYICYKNTAQASQHIEPLREV
jgi:hypothetical protein